MNAARFHARVEACFDERIDPLDDPAVVAFLDAHPEHLPAFAERRACIAAVTALGTPRTNAPQRRRRWLLRVGAAAAAAALAIVMLRLDTDQRPPSSFLASTVHETRPRANVAASFELRQVIASSTTRLELYERRTEPR